MTGHHIVETARGMFPLQQCFCIPCGFPFLDLIDSLSGLSLDTRQNNDLRIKDPEEFEAGGTVQ